jgi:zinc protease
MRLAILALVAAAAAQPQPVRTIPLSNGMKILVQEDHNIPNVAMYLFYRIGSRNERPGTTGLSHFFEHMMFNGAKKYSPKQFDNEMEKAGGHNNAYTTNNVTVYTDWFPSAALELMFDMEADRIRDLSFDPKIIESERGVVYSERRSSIDNSPFGTLAEQLDAAAFIAHPYGWPVVGWPSDIESWTMDDLKAHFRMGYAPNNCTVVIVGDVASAQVASLAKKYLEPISSQDPPPPVRTKEPPQLGERRIVVNRPAQLPLQMMAYHVPQSTHPDHPALSVLVALLTHGQSSRLYRRMVDREQLAIRVEAEIEESFDPYILRIVIQPGSGVDPSNTEKALGEELARLQTTDVAPDELRKAKNQMLAAHYRELKSIAGRANLLGTYEVFRGDYQKLFTVPEEIDRVTAADIRRVAGTYLTPRNLTVATLIPEHAPTKAQEAGQ